MFARIPQRLRVFGAAVVIGAVLGTVGCDDSAKVKELQEKVAALEAKVAALEKQAKAEPSAKSDDEAYLKATAGAMLDALLAGDVAALDGKMTPKMLKGIDASVSAQFHQAIPNVNTWITNWNKQKQFKTYTIEKFALSPNKEEAVIEGMLASKPENGAGAFTMTLAKDKGNKYLLDACTMKVK